MSKKCTWIDTGDGEYTTSCKNEYHLWHLYENNTTLEGAGIRFCPYCSKEIIIK